MSMVSGRAPAFPDKRPSARTACSLNSAWSRSPALLETTKSLLLPDVKPLDASVFDLKNVPDHLVGEEVPFEIPHHLMRFDDHFLSCAFRKRNRLDVGIDHCPLPRPIAAHSFAPADMSAFHAICPNYIFVQGCENRLHVASIEAIVDSLK